MRETQKMEALGHLAGGIAHDFNNLLQVITGYAELAARVSTPDHPSQKLLQQVLDAADRAAALTGQLLTFSRRDALKSQRVRLDAVATDFVKILSRVIGNNTRLVIADGPAVPPIEADRNEIEQVIMNLCVNGRDAMTDGGTIAIQAGQAVFSYEDCRERSWARPGDWVFLRVADEGCGIPEKIRPYVFERFFTTKGAGRGTGLGLATVSAIVERHGGLIELHSEAGVGTTFTIYFPAASPDTASTDPVALDADDAPAAVPTPDDDAWLAIGGGATVLVADDDAPVRDMLVEVLETAGYRCLVAADGARAEALVQARASEIDVAILDMAMPFRNGRQVYETIQQVRPAMPVIFCSGSGLSEPEDGMPLPGAAVLPKPYSRVAMLAALRDAIGQARSCAMPVCSA